MKSLAEHRFIDTSWMERRNDDNLELADALELDGVLLSACCMVGLEFGSMKNSAPLMPDSNSVLDIVFRFGIVTLRVRGPIHLVNVCCAEAML